MLMCNAIANVVLMLIALAAMASGLPVANRLIISGQCAGWMIAINVATVLLEKWRGG